MCNNQELPVLLISLNPEILDRNEKGSLSMIKYDMLLSFLTLISFCVYRLQDGTSTKSNTLNEEVTKSERIGIAEICTVFRFRFMESVTLDEYIHVKFNCSY